MIARRGTAFRRFGTTLRLVDSDKGLRRVKIFKIFFA